MPEEHYPRLVNQSPIALQVVTAGNLRTTLMIGDLCRKANQLIAFLSLPIHQPAAESCRLGCFI
jgi:enamidase